MNLFANIDWMNIGRAVVGGAAVGVVASLIFSCNFRIWNKFESVRRVGPQLICLASYLVNLAIFFATVIYVITEVVERKTDAISFVFMVIFAALPFAFAIRSGFIPKRNSEK